MEKKSIMAFIALGEGRGQEDPAQLAAAYQNQMYDGLVVFDLATSREAREENLLRLKEICRSVDIPVWAGGHINRLEDVKKVLYAGCARAILNASKENFPALLAEGSGRFGSEKLAFSVKDGFQAVREISLEHQKLSSAVLVLEEPAQQEPGIGWAVPAFYMAESCQGDGHRQHHRAVPAFYMAGSCQGETAGHCPEEMPKSCPEERDPVDSKAKEAVASLLENPAVSGVFGPAANGVGESCMDLKWELDSRGIPMQLYKSTLEWGDFKLNSDGLLPVVVQEYRSGAVLMVAYMNEEAFSQTVRTGRMVYYSRSRQELWVKGLTSGHFQYVKLLRVDCDKDTLLAQVAQLGAACHTGSESCFYTSIWERPHKTHNPLEVLETVYGVILDRKEHPKEGSYTNYLFDQGIDKILKKVGEEAAEIIIAAKNPDAEEVKYEFSDFLYHMMVLMAQKGLTWEDITEELARRE